CRPPLTCTTPGCRRTCTSSQSSGRSTGIPGISSFSRSPAMRADRQVILLVAFTLAAGIPLDALGPAGSQAIVNVWTWGALLWVVWRSDSVHRRELAACVVFATAGELFLMEGWGLYHYRLHNLPLFIPPGHALVFTAAMRISRRVPSWFP